jgi:hypothetical protein
MSHADIQQILDMIDHLPESDRDVLEQQLALRSEAEWRTESARARRQAKLCGINQAAIDEAVRKHRYGQ